MKEIIQLYGVKLHVKSVDGTESSYLLVNNLNLVQAMLEISYLDEMINVIPKRKNPNRSRYWVEIVTAGSTEKELNIEPLFQVFVYNRENGTSIKVKKPVNRETAENWIALYGYHYKQLGLDLRMISIDDLPVSDR